MIRFIINFYIVIIIIDAILSYFPQFKDESWAKMIKKAADYTTKPVRKLLPADLPFDLSPLIVIFILNLVKILW